MTPWAQAHSRASRYGGSKTPTFCGGAGTYVDNLKIDGMLTLYFVRSPIAHATIRSIDVKAAREMPGVVGVYSADDLDFPNAPALMLLHPAAIRPSLAKGTVNFVGDPVVVVVAESTGPGHGRRRVGGDRLRAARGRRRHGGCARARFAAAVRVDRAATSSSGCAPAARTRSPDADVVVRGRFENQRVAVVPMEGSAIAVDPTGTDFDLTVHLACQMPHMIRGVLSGLLGLDPERMRVIAPNVGGSFGAKHLSAEGVVAAKLALELGRPVKWVETRSENMVALSHGRGQVQYVELGLKRDGTFVGMRCRMIGDAGGYGGFGGILVLGQTKVMAQGVYHIPADRLRCGGRRHQHHADGRLPRGGSSRGSRLHRADRRHGGRRARHRPDRDTPQEFHPTRRVPADHGHGRRLRQRRLRSGAGRGRCASPTTTLSAASRPKGARTAIACSSASGSPVMSK